MQCVRMAKNAKAVLLLAVAISMESEREPAVQRRPLLVWIALNSNVDIIGEVEVLLEQPQHFVEKIAESIFLVLIQQTDDVGGLRLAFEGRPSRLTAISARVKAPGTSHRTRILTSFQLALGP